MLVIYEIGVNKPDIYMATALFHREPRGGHRVNGEGTFYIDQPYVLRLLEPVRGAEARTGLLTRNLPR